MDRDGDATYKDKGAFRQRVTSAIDAGSGTVSILVVAWPVSGDMLVDDSTWLEMVFWLRSGSILNSALGIDRTRSLEWKPQP